MGFNSGLKGLNATSAEQNKETALANGDHSRRDSSWTKIPAIFRGIFGNFAVFNIIHLFIPRFLKIL
jgi:hypothetical protein